jgi:hypothetical protein
MIVSLKIFVSYAKEDREHALKYYDLLLQEGMTPWIDVKHILPGQNWEAEIGKALLDAHLVVLPANRHLRSTVTFRAV